LAQRHNQPTDPALTDRLRPLTLGITHLGEQPGEGKAGRVNVSEPLMMLRYF
jgi:hypothetical protein